ncbi:auxin response factor 16-like [Dorcoceras hygrometricum]|uniref:Auxin response factor 16-like n=1 Tax=Dorcoceras hygrometricum TaxID=472368 RepID=A0A2Z7ANY4_9LAMI|nr:auxin response factor 16-like [Dorcoceras hygrometricum]
MNISKLEQYNQFFIRISVLGKTESELINSVLADDLDEVSEWIKRTRKHTMTLSAERYNQFFIRISVLGKTESELINSVLADDLDEVSEWIKRTRKHTMTLDEKNRAELVNQIREEKT